MIYEYVLEEFLTLAHSFIQEKKKKENTCNKAALCKDQRIWQTEGANSKKEKNLML